MLERHPWGDLADPAREDAPDLAILGIPYEGSACWRPGAAEAPARLREISNTSPAISEDGFIVEPAQLRVRDFGDVEPDGVRVGGGSGAEAARQQYFAQVEGRWLEIQTLARNAGHDAFILSLGGDHSVTIPLVRAFARSVQEPFGLISLDAHPDLWDIYDDSALSAACPLRRALETGSLLPEHLLILGTRSYNAVELDFMRANGIRFVPAREIEQRGVEAIVTLAAERLAGVRRVYLTLDIDVADPACAPGTGAPVAGGLSSRQTLDLARGLLERLPIGAMDIVEIAPPLDPTDATLFLGLQIVFETFAVLAQRADDT